MSSFVHLHVHSHYSLLDGLSKIPSLVADAKKKGMETLALTDHGALYGAIEFYEECLRQRVKPIIGVEAYLAPGSRHEKLPQEQYYHLVLLAETFEGYKNLLKLTTAAHLEGYYYHPRIDWELLERWGSGLIALSGCLRGQIPRFILSNASEHTIGALVRQYQRVFGQPSFFLELQHRPTLPDQAHVNAALIDIARRLSVPLVATNDSHYLASEDQEAQDVLLCLQTKSKKADRNRLSMLGEDYSLKSPQAMEEIFRSVPEALENTVAIAQRCSVDIPLKEIKLPRFITPNGDPPVTYLRSLVVEGFKRRLDERVTPAYTERLEYELSVIERMGFASYFLIVADFVNWARSQGIMVGPGRGSAAGSLVSYLLYITNVDPLQYGLFFERFLNMERIAMPDIDLDFADRRRNEVLSYVADKYGHDHVAQIITFGTMAARAAVRDCGRVLGMSYSFCDAVAKRIPLLMNLADAMGTVAELKDVYDRDQEARLVLDTARKVEDVARHTSTHACGVVITDEPLVEYVPLQYASSDDRTIICQYDLHSVEDLGLLKIDFLGLANLTILEDALSIIHKRHGLTLNLDAIPLDDALTFGLLERADTTGVFQLESSGIKRYLRELKPTTLEDIIAMVALYRPGPMDLIPDFIAGKHGRRTITYLHPKLEPILKHTYGIAVYQEQVLQIARDIAGFSLSEADVLRKAIGKKIKSLLLEQREKFIDGAVAQGVGHRVAEQLFDFTEPFARYGFNRAHATCYGLIAYHTAYLKAHFPVEFMTALLISEQGKVDRIAVVVKECQDMGIRVVGPDVNVSGVDFTASGEGKTTAIHFGLSAIKNIGEGVAEAIVVERGRRGPFETIEDFLLRLEGMLNKKSLESLIKSGALDRFGDRSHYIGNLEKVSEFARRLRGAPQADQTTLFHFVTHTSMPPALRLDPVASERRDVILQWEKELLGLYVSEHPMKALRDYVKRLSFPYERVLGLDHNQPAVVAGLVTTVKRITTKGGETMLFVRLEDEENSLETIVFPSVYQQATEVWKEGSIVLVRGKVTVREGVRQIVCDRAIELTAERAESLLKAMYSSQSPHP